MAGIGEAHLTCTLMIILSTLVCIKRSARVATGITYPKLLRRASLVSTVFGPSISSPILNYHDMSSVTTTVLQSSPAAPIPIPSFTKTCHQCGADLSHSHPPVPEDAQRRIAELETQVRILTGKATAAGTFFSCPYQLHRSYSQHGLSILYRILALQDAKSRSSRQARRL